MRTKRLCCALASIALLAITATAEAAAATREPSATTAGATQLRARLGSGIADWRAARPPAKAALVRAPHVYAPRLEEILARVDGIVGRLDKQLATGHMTPVHLAGFAGQLQSEEDKLRQEVKDARDKAKTGFEDADQRLNQLLNILIGIVRSINEMRGGNCKGCL